MRLLSGSEKGKIGGKKKRERKKRKREKKNYTPRSLITPFFLRSELDRDLI